MLRRKNKVLWTVLGGVIVSSGLALMLHAQLIDERAVQAEDETYIENDQLFVDGKRASGPYVFQHKLYVDGVFNKGLTLYESKKGPLLFLNENVYEGSTIYDYKGQQTLFQKGRIPRGFHVYQNRLWKDGVLYTAFQQVGDRFFENGQPMNGTVNGTAYVDGYKRDTLTDIPVLKERKKQLLDYYEMALRGLHENAENRQAYVDVYTTSAIDFVYALKNIVDEQPSFQTLGSQYVATVEKEMATLEAHREKDVTLYKDYFDTALDVWYEKEMPAIHVEASDDFTLPKLDTLSVEKATHEAVRRAFMKAVSKKIRRGTDVDIQRVRISVGGKYAELTVVYKRRHVIKGVDIVKVALEKAH